MWTSSKAMHTVALKFDAGPLGQPVALDPDHLISVDNRAVLDYITMQMSKVYPPINTKAGAWNALRKELDLTGTKSHEAFQLQSQKAKRFSIK